MKQSLAGVSLILFGLSVIFLIVWTVFESTFAGMSGMAERILTFALLVVPAGIGVVLGVMSLLQKEGRKWLATTSIILNSVFAIFHLMIVLFAG